jgi:hypothetical protein
VQRPAQAGDLDQAAPLPQLLADLAAADSGDPQADGQLGGRHDLRVDAADRAHHVDQPLAWRGLDQEVPPQPEFQHLSPGQRSHRHRLYGGDDHG